MILKFEDSGRSLLGFIAPFDVSWLDNVTLSNDISFTEGKEGILMKVLLNDNEICTLEYYLDPDSQDTHAGGSGCGCVAAVSCGWLMKRMERGELKRVLLVGSGAMFSPTSTQQGETIPGIAYAVCLEGGEK